MQVRHRRHQIALLTRASAVANPGTSGDGASFPPGLRDLVDGAVRPGRTPARGGGGIAPRSGCRRRGVRVHHGDEVVLEQGLGAQLGPWWRRSPRSRSPARHGAGAASLSGLARKCPHPGPRRRGRRQQGGAHRLHEAVTGSQAEGAPRLAGSTSRWGRSTARVSLNQAGNLHPADLRPGVGDQAASRPHQQRIPVVSHAALPGPGSWRKHSGQPSGGARHLPLPAGIQGDQQVEIRGHGRLPHRGGA